jgi:hypothetical protein
MSASERSISFCEPSFLVETTVLISQAAAVAQVIGISVSRIPSFGVTITSYPRILFLWAKCAAWPSRAPFVAIASSSVYSSIFVITSVDVLITRISFFEELFSKIVPIVLGIVRVVET